MNLTMPPSVTFREKFTPIMQTSSQFGLRLRLLPMEC